MSDNSLAFSTADVVIAEDGRVIITNPIFAKNLISHVKRLSPDTVGFFDNCDCKKSTPTEVHLSKVLPAVTLRLDPGEAGIFDNCSCKGREIGSPVARG